MMGINYYSQPSVSVQPVNVLDLVLVRLGSQRDPGR